MNNIQNKKGFTLLEMVVAVGIITLGTLGVFSVITRYSQYTQIIRENFVASYLAQEGIEIVKNIRDTNWVSGASSWKSGLTSCSSGCEADYNTSLTAWSGSGRFLYIEDATKLYKYIDSPLSNDIETPWKRKITITEVGDDELDIQVDVYWGTYSTVVKQNIYNWRP